MAACNPQTLKISEVHSCSNNVDDSSKFSSDSSVASDMVDNIGLADELPVTVNSNEIFVVAL